MQLHLINKPNIVTTSGNPIPFTLSLTPYGPIEQREDIRVLVTIYKAAGNGLALGATYNEIYSQVLIPNADGIVMFDARSIIDAHLQFFTPRYSTAQIQYVESQCLNFQIGAILQVNGVQKDLLRISPFAVLKGGLSFHQFNRNFLQHHVFENKKPLNFYADKEMVSIEQQAYMFFMAHTTSTENLKAHLRVWLDDGTEVNRYTDVYMTPLKYCVYSCPVGYKQISSMLASRISGTPYKYTITIFAGDTVMVAPQTFHIDNRKNYNDSTLLYRNSLGGLDSIRIKGEIEFKAEYEMQTAKVVAPPSGYTNALLTHTNANNSNTETENFIGWVGFVTKEKIDYLRDLLLSKTVYEVKSERMIPVIVNKKNITFYKSTDGLFSLQLEWQHAFENEYFTPLSAASFPTTCPAVISLKAVQNTKDTVRILAQMPEPHELLEVNIKAAGSATEYSYVLHGHAISEIVNFENPSIGDEETLITVTGRVICDNTISPVSQGPQTTTSFTAKANTPPVAADDVFTIPSGFSSAVVLEGSVLDNDYDLDYDAIEVIAASGATEEGGTYSITDQGIVTYTPPSTSFVGEDKFNYSIQESATPGATATATVRILVGNVAIGDIVYVRIQTRNERTFNQTKIAEIWAELFADPLCTIPKPTTDLNLNYRVLKERSNNNGLSWFDESDQTESRIFTGGEKLLYSGIIYNQTTVTIGITTITRLQRLGITVRPHTTGPRYVAV